MIALRFTTWSFLLELINVCDSGTICCLLGQNTAICFDCNSAPSLQFKVAANNGVLLRCRPVSHAICQIFVINARIAYRASYSLIQSKVGIYIFS